MSLTNVVLGAEAPTREGCRHKSLTHVCEVPQQKKKKRLRVPKQALKSKKNPGGQKREPRGKITLPGKREDNPTDSK